MAQQTDDKKQQEQLTVCQRLNIDRTKLEKPHIANPFPYSRKLEPGKEYLFCTCGLSTQQPFCDQKECIECKFQPLKFIAKNQTMSLLCGCKRNSQKAGPYCDGSHSNLDW
ncbi:hypothetical protein ABPG72_009341 [Tetrahymena utriculariae]